MATKLRADPRPPAKSGRGELDRLRGLVAEQHRRLRLVHGRPAEALETALAQSFPCRCEKPRLSRTALARLIEEARLRLELGDTSLGASIRAAWPAEPCPSVPVLRPTPGLGAYALRGLPELRNLVVALFGHGPDAARRAIERVQAEQRGTEPFAPVFLTNDTDFTPFSDQRLAFEYFPFELDEAAPAPEPGWAAYLLETLELTMRRWGVRRIISP